jgi:hypothetical protein
VLEELVILQREAVGTSATKANFYQTSWCHMPINNYVHVATLFVCKNKHCKNALILQFVIHFNTKYRNNVIYMHTRILNLLQYNLCVLSSAPAIPAIFCEKIFTHVNG